MTTRNRQLIVYIDGETYYAAQKTQETLGMTYSAVKNQVIAGNITARIPKGKRQLYYKAKDVEELARELNAFMGQRKKKNTKLVRVTSREDLNECMEISQALFGVGRGGADQRMGLIEKNPDTYYLLKDEEQAIGYFSIMPLKPGNVDHVLSQTLPVKIDDEEIATFSRGTKVDLYLIAIGVKPIFPIGEKRIYGSRLISGLIELIIDLGRREVEIGTIAARSNTPDGIRLMRHMGFNEIEPLTPERRTFVIDVKKSGIPFILQYKEALKEATQKQVE